MLVYTICRLNRNKQHWEGKGKHGKGKKGVCVVSQLFLSGTVVCNWPLFCEGKTSLGREQEPITPWAPDKNQ